MNSKPLAVQDPLRRGRGSIPEAGPFVGGAARGPLSPAPPWGGCLRPGAPSLGPLRRARPSGVCARRFAVAAGRACGPAPVRGRRSAPLPSGRWPPGPGVCRPACWCSQQLVRPPRRGALRRGAAPWAGPPLGGPRGWLCWSGAAGASAARGLATLRRGGFAGGANAPPASFPEEGPPLHRWPSRYHFHD